MGNVIRCLNLAKFLQINPFFKNIVFFSQVNEYLKGVIKNHDLTLINTPSSIKERGRFIKHNIKN